MKLGKAVIGRDEKAVIKTVSAFIKILHPCAEPSEEEFNEYLEYALEGRRRVKEQLHKRKSDGEFADLDFSYFDQQGKEVFVSCPESVHLTKQTDDADDEVAVNALPEQAKTVKKEKAEIVEVDATSDPVQELKEQHFTIRYGSRGYGYEGIMLDYMKGAQSVFVQDPYIRAPHQIVNFQKFCEVVVKSDTIRKIELHTSSEHPEQEDEVKSKLFTLSDSLRDFDIELVTKWIPHIHDRAIKLSNGWVIKIGRGLDYFQKPDDWMSIGVHDLEMRQCLETDFNIYKEK
jgi:ATP-dependent Lon protease